MAELRFYFGTMGSGKSTQALQIHHNMSKGGLGCLLLTQLDRGGGVVSSRLGVAAQAIEIDADVDLFALVSEADQGAGGLHAVICDEAQFYRPEQVDQLCRVVDQLGIEVYAFGLLTSFQGLLFPGTKRLLEVSDHRFELQVEARCWCGARATHNARFVNGRQVYEGDLMVVGDAIDRSNAGSDDDDPGDGGGGAALTIDVRPQETTYGLRCRRHWLAGAAGVERTVPTGPDGDQAVANS